MRVPNRAATSGNGLASARTVGFGRPGTILHSIRLSNASAGRSDEMAELAETLVELQSLKEKVTKPTESVGGPIDVAVISKADGFIWIKRKHYFDPALNPRFLARQSRKDA